MNNTSSNEKKGIITAIFGSLCLGLAGITDKLGAIASKQPFLYSTQTIFVAFCFTVVYSFLFKKKSVKDIYKKLDPTSWLQLLLIGCFAFGIAILLRFIGLLQSTGTFASLSQVITVAFTGMLAHVFLKEQLSKGFWFLFLFIVIATYFVSVGSFSLVTIKSGDAFIVCAALFVAIGNIIAKLTVHKVNPIFVAVGEFFFGFLFLFFINIVFFFHSTPFLFPLFAILSGLFWAGCGISFNLALNCIGATLTTSLFMLAPIVTLIIEATFLSYRFTPLQYGASFVVVASGVLLVLKGK